LCNNFKELRFKSLLEEIYTFDRILSIVRKDKLFVKIIIVDFTIRKNKTIVKIIIRYSPYLFLFSFN